MVLGIQKPFGLTPEQLLRTQLAYDVAQLRSREVDIKVSRCALA